MKSKLSGIAAVLVAAALIASVGCSSPAATPAGGGSQAPAKKVVKIALSNSYIGNKWRAEMVNDFKSVCASTPWKDDVQCSVYNSGNDVSKQSQDIQNLIAERVDAILVDASSPTGLNGVIKQACDKGILVISFDSFATAECGLVVNTDQKKYGEMAADWLVKKMNGQGNVIMVTGVAGTGVDTDRNAGAEAVFAKNPGVKVVAKYPGDWDSATALRNTAAQLPSLPQVDGVWAQGGTDGVLKAFISAGKPLPFVAGEAENGFRKFMLKDGYPGPDAALKGKKVEGFSIGQPPYLSVVALEMARQILQGKMDKKSIDLPFPTVTNDTAEIGVNVFPDLDDSFFTTFTDSGPSAVVSLCKEAAIDGTPCPNGAKVQLPAQK